MGDPLVYLTYVRKPFTVEAVEVTAENIETLAPMVGELKAFPDGTPFIDVDPKKVPHVTRVRPGFFVTKMGKKIQAYSPTAFKKQFTDADEVNLEWVRYLNSES